MSNLAFDTLNRARPIWVARLILFYLLIVQVRHQMQDFGGYGMDSLLYAIAMEVSISVGVSGIATILLTGTHWARFLILIFVPVLFIGAQNSVDASMRVFAKNKVDQIEHERLGVEGQMSRNNLIMSGNALNNLREQGITSGLAYKNALAAYQAARAEMQTSRKRGEASTSEKALELTEGEDKTTDEKVLEIAERRAWLLLGFVLLFSAVSGLWTMLTSDINWQSFTGASRAKKPLGSSQPKQKKAVELVDFGGEDTALTPGQPSKQAVSGRAEGRGQTKTGLSSSAQSGFSESTSRAAAKEVAGQIKAGEFIRKNGQQAVDVLSTRDLVSHSASKKTQAAIMTHLEHMGVVEKQGGKKPARITDAYRPIDPGQALFDEGKIATTSKGRLLIAQDDAEPDEVERALWKWGGIDKPTAKRLAAKATGDTTKERLESALKQHASAA